MIAFKSLVELDLLTNELSLTLKLLGTLKLCGYMLLIIGHLSPREE